MQHFITVLDGPVQGTELVAAYNAGLVLLSYVVASFAAYPALDFAARVSESGVRTRTAKAWLAGGAFAMGTGIWDQSSFKSLTIR